MRAHVFRFAPNSGHRLPDRACPKSAIDLRRSSIEPLGKYVPIDRDHASCHQHFSFPPWIVSKVCWGASLRSWVVGSGQCSSVALHGLAQLQSHPTFGGLPDGRLWVKGGRRPVVGWLTLVDKINQDSTNGQVGQSTPGAAVEPKAGPSARRAPLFPKIGKYHQSYCGTRPLREPECEEVPATYGLIHLFCGGRFHH